MATQSISSSSVTRDDSLAGKRINKYQIVRLLGRGGMGTVYEALNTGIGKRVAMKFVDAESARSKEAVARFHREAEAASAVESAHIVDIFDSGVTEEGLPFIVMELLRGEDLGHRIKRCGRLEIPEALHIVAQILRGLFRAHEAGIVHRDLKPDNIFLVERDDDPNFVKILDFGISKFQKSGSAPVQTLTRQGTVLGTPFYMSPEQAQALPEIDGRTDLWSVGAILYECLSGRPPHTGGSYEQVIVNICMHDVEDVRHYNPVVPELLALVIAKALSRNRDERFSTAREFLDALKATSSEIVAISSGRGAVTPFPGLSSSDFRLTPRGSAGGTPHAAATPIPKETLATAPTVESNQENAVSRIGWSTSRHDAARLDKRTVLVIAGLVVLLGGGAAALMLRDQGNSTATQQPATLAAPAATPNVPSTPEPSARPEPSATPSAAPEVTPAPTLSASTEASGVKSPPPPVPPPSARATATPKATSAPTSPPTSPPTGPPTSPPTSPPISPPTAAPQASTPPPPEPTGTGVAGQLQLKTE